MNKVTIAPREGQAQIAAERIIQARAIINAMIGNRTHEAPLSDEQMENLAWAADTLLAQAQDATIDHK